VSDKGNKRVRNEKRKNVHAYIQGRGRCLYDCYTVPITAVAITYDPYKYKSFVRMDTGKPVYKAKVVVFGCGKRGREVKALF
jgi:hypothetical protein